MLLHLEFCGGDSGASRGTCAAHDKSLKAVFGALLETDRRECVERVDVVVALSQQQQRSQEHVLLGTAAAEIRQPACQGLEIVAVLAAQQNPEG